MNKPALKYITPEEYLVKEEAAEYKSEYYRGEIYAMAGGSQDHNRIVLDLGTALNLALKGAKCEAYVSDMKLWVEARDLFTYPDLMVVCEKPKFYEGRKDILTNPLVIV